MTTKDYRHEYKLCRECDTMVWIPAWRKKEHKHIVLNIEDKWVPEGYQQALV